MSFPISIYSFIHISVSMCLIDEFKSIGWGCCLYWYCSTRSSPFSCKFKNWSYQKRKEKKRKKGLCLGFLHNTLSLIFLFQIFGMNMWNYGPDVMDALVDLIICLVTSSEWIIPYFPLCNVYLLMWVCNDCLSVPNCRLLPVENLSTHLWTCLLAILCLPIISSMCWVNLEAS